MTYSLDNPTLKYIEENYYVDGGSLRRKHTYKQWEAGLAVGETVGKRGYKTISIKGKRYYTHRIIFLLTHGYLVDLIDHVDGDKTNNHPDNLRGSDKVNNALNLHKPHKDNESGYLGVTFRKDTGRYSARLQDKSLGCFDTPEEAHEQYLKHKGE